MIVTSVAECFRSGFSHKDCSFGWMDVIPAIIFVAGVIHLFNREQEAVALSPTQQRKQWLRRRRETLDLSPPGEPQPFTKMAKKDSFRARLAPLNPVLIEEAEERENLKKAERAGFLRLKQDLRPLPNKVP